ncbi:MAG TPA: AMP-binding protein [Bacteroidia bacterium]|nr:AMP-binding protein [Bacteroidia bacterium]
MQLLNNLQESFTKFKDRNCFFINGQFYTYHAFAQCITNIRKSIEQNTNNSENIIGIIANDDLETYASIIACWFECKAYVPISPETPIDRNQKIIDQALIKTILNSGEPLLFTDIKIIDTKKLPVSTIDLVPKKVMEENLAYLLFTSGTTGMPKGVPISFKNVNGFTEAFWKIGFKLNEDDRCLQMFELTFDLSVMSYLIPLLKGACIYTIPKDKIKYSYIFELMEEQLLTFALMVPSILHFLRPYFDEIDLPQMKYSLFCGEALPLDVTEEWQKCLPNAAIYNVYGPTEDTIFCTYYLYAHKGNNKSRNGILSIGKAMNNTSTIIIDENNNILPAGESGQLCLGGVQLTPGYWHNEEKNKEAFFMLNHNNKDERFYKTGDLCLCDTEGDILYLGRLDYQTKIQGFRVELSEIEFHVKAFLEKNNAVAVALVDHIGNTEIGLIIESKPFQLEPLQEYMKSRMPHYMIPRKITFTDVFPLNTNGKTDRKKLELLFA